MKKLFLILTILFAYSLSAQTLQNPTYGNTTTNTLKIKTPATVTSVNFLPAFDADGITLSKINPVNLPMSTVTQTALDSKIAGTGSVGYIPFFTSGKTLSFTELYTDSNLNINKDKIAQPTAAPTVSVSSTAGLLNGNYYYSCSYYTAVGETEANVGTGVLAVNLKQVNISNIPISPDSEVIGRRIYRTSGTAISGVHGKKLLVDIPNNTTTTYVDNTPDSSLGADLKWTNTTSGVYKQNGTTVFDTSGGNLQVGFGAVARGYANTSVGSYAMAANVSGLRNSAFSLYALYSNVDGEENTAGGVHALNFNANGSYNTAWGYGPLFNNLGSRNTAIGRGVFEFNVNGNGLVGLGHNAGNLETGSNKLYIDNQNRGSEALGRTSALVYGVFDPVVANQTIRFNANASALNLSGTNTGDAYVKNITDTQSITSSVPVFFDSAATPSNSPTGSDTFVQGFQSMSNGNALFKQIIATNGTDLFYRSQSNGSWGAWKRFWNDTNLPNPASTVSPNFTGTPTAPTATAGTNTTQIATTAFVQANARPYKVYSGFITQSGTSAPVATVLENTLGGTVVWSYTAVGQYEATLTNAFTANKTLIFTMSGTGATNEFFVGNYGNSTVSTITFTHRDGTGTAVNGIQKASVEIRVYL